MKKGNTSFPKSNETYDPFPVNVAVPVSFSKFSAFVTDPSVLKMAVGLTVRESGAKLNASQGPFGAPA